jgi:DNA excision repair protein ERCC-1
MSSSVGSVAGKDFPPSSSSSKGNANAILVNNDKQRGNPVLKYIKNVPWEFNKDIVPDFVMGYTCATFISVKYHLLHPTCAEMKLRELGKTYRLRVLLVLVDDDNNMKALHELNKICFAREITMLLCWSNEECARYLETLKVYENKPPSSIQEKVENEFMPQLNRALTNVRSVNKTDVVTLLGKMISISYIFSAIIQRTITKF